MGRKRAILSDELSIPVDLVRILRFLNVDTEIAACSGSGYQVDVASVPCKTAIQRVALCAPLVINVNRFPIRVIRLTAAPSLDRLPNETANCRQWARRLQSPAARVPAPAVAHLLAHASAVPIAPRQRRTPSAGKVWGNGSSRAEHNTGGVIFAWDFGSYPLRHLADPRLKDAIFMRC